MDTTRVSVGHGVEVSQGRETAGELAGGGEGREDGAGVGNGQPTIASGSSRALCTLKTSVWITCNFSLWGWRVLVLSSFLVIIAVQPFNHHQGFPPEVRAFLSGCGCWEPGLDSEPMGRVEVGVTSLLLPFSLHN